LGPYAIKPPASQGWGTGPRPASPRCAVSRGRLALGASSGDGRR
jgi:hypothetical protein